MGYQGITQQDAGAYDVATRADALMPPFDSLDKDALIRFIELHFIMPGHKYTNWAIEDQKAREILRQFYEGVRSGSKEGFDNIAFPRRLSELERMHSHEG